MDMNNPKNNRELSERRRRYKYGRRLLRVRLVFLSQLVATGDEVRDLLSMSFRHVAIHIGWCSIPSRRMLVRGIKCDSIDTGRWACVLEASSVYRRESKVKLRGGVFDKRSQSLYVTSLISVPMANYAISRFPA